MLGISGSAMKAAESQPMLKVLLEIGGYEGHDMKACAALVKLKLEATGQFIVGITDDWEQFRKENVLKYDLVVSCICARDDIFTEEWEEGLSGFVGSGKGFVGLHGSTDSFWNSDVYWRILGGRFTWHGQGTHTVKITDSSHAIVKGMADFEVIDETYCHTFHPDSKVTILARRDCDSEPAAWVQDYGKGRVFCTSIGHDHQSWDVAGYQELVTRACLWAAKRIS
jgi:type 1 glutamine amidotransferase